jgi:intein/homing endonuclease
MNLAINNVKRYTRPTKLAWDDQVNFYLLARTLVTGKPVTKVIYTVCQKPTIRLKQNETEEQYLARVSEWYTEDKIKLLTVTRSVNELKETEGEIREMTSQIRRQKYFYRNPGNCKITGCSYSSICLNYDPEITTGFAKKERRNEELSCAF